jgi:hypothetical protein
MRTPNRISKSLLALAIVALMAVPAAALLSPAFTAGATAPGAASGPAAPGVTASALAHAPAVPITYSEPGRRVPGAHFVGPAPASLSIPLLITFQFTNDSRLTALLAGLQDPNSAQYHAYLTATQSDQEFGQSVSTYAATTEYLQTVGATDVQTFADRLSVSFDASPAVAASIFHTSIDMYAISGRTYYAPSSAPELPTPIASLVAGVDGLSSYSTLSDHPLHAAPAIHAGGTFSASPRASALDGFPSPVTTAGVQYEYSSDFQVAYDELSLFADQGYPTNMVAATILSGGAYGGGATAAVCGSLTVGQAVGPFVPGDIYSFYNQTLPVGEPHAHVAGVPVDGAAWPGPTAQCDSTGANVENTLDLETLGSLAPGATIYNVYGPTLSNVDADDAFAFILNPNATVPGLANVSVISNSWGGTDGFDAGWNSSIALAAVRGITVLVASGDSGSNPNGDGGGQDPPGQTTFFPASMAYDTYGDVAVGGTTVTLDPSTLQMTGDIAWNESDLYTGGFPGGSTGGISQIFPAPSWQNDTSANNLTQGQGRGEPDIAALANNTIMTISSDGYYYNSSNASSGANYIQVAGTSIASPLTAGIVLEADHVLAATNSSWLGFLDPMLYSLANEQFSSVPTSSSGAIGFIPTGTYLSPLPTLPFIDVTVGQNWIDSALPGYDLVTGWGSLDAYNYTMYFATAVPANQPGEFSSVQAAFNLTGLDGSSTSPYYNASIQQNFFVANGLGAPIYWVQNVIYINGTPGAWQMNFSGWVIYPFWGLYPSNSTYEYNFPLTGQTLSTPLDFTLVTALENTSVMDGQSVQFSFGIPGTTPLTLPLPGGAYILGGLWENYSWGGTLYSNNPLEGGAPGSLSPQFGLVGGPSGGLTTFNGTTGGNLQLSFQRFGSTAWVPGATQKFGEDIDQTGESAADLKWTLVTPANLTTGAPANWSLGLSSGSTEQGVLQVDPYVHIPTFPTTFTATGLNGLPWGIQLSTGQHAVSSTSQLLLPLANGTYYWVATPPPDYSVVPNHGTFVVDGTAPQIALAFTLVQYNVTLIALALPAGYEWWANVTFHTVGTVHTVSYDTTLGSLTFESANGTLDIAFAGEQNWSGQPPTTDLNVAGAPVVFHAAFSPPPKYLVTFQATGLPAFDRWALSISGNSTNLTTNGSSLGRTLVNGSYSFRAVTTAGGYFAVAGKFGVDGAPRVVIVAFFPAVYTVTFQETGLPTGSLWGVQIAGGPFLSTGASNLTWSAENATYNYTILSESTGWAPAPNVGVVVVAGAASTVAVTFQQVTYPVTFRISGLPTGTTWGVSLNGGPPSESTGAAITLSLPNGTYQFSISLPSDWSATPSAGTITVAGSPGNVALAAGATKGTSGAGGPLGLGTWGYAVLVGLLIAVLIIAAVLLLTRRPPPPKASVAVSEPNADGSGTYGGS